MVLGHGPRRVRPLPRRQRLRLDRGSRRLLRRARRLRRGGRQLHRHRRHLHAPEHGHLGDDHRRVDGGARQPRRARHRDQGRARTAASAREHRAHADESLARLRTDRIDLYYAHKDDGSVPVEETVARVRRAGARRARCCTSAMSNTTGERLPSRWSWPSARACAATSGCSRTTTSSSATATSASSRRSWPRDGLAVAPYYALASGFLTGKYRGGAERRQPAGGEGDAYLDARGEAVLAALDEVAAEHGVAGRRDRRRLARWPSPGSPPPIAQRPRRPSSSRRVLPAVGLELTADQISRLDEASA